MTVQLYVDVSVCVYEGLCVVLMFQCI